MNEPMKTMFSQSITAVSATRKEQVGTKRVLDDGREFHYARNGAVALVIGVPVEGVATVAHHWDCAVVETAVAVGKTTVTITLAATAVTLNQYAGGFLQINDGAGQGRQYKIDYHPAADLSTDVIVQLSEPVGIALAAATSKAALIPSKYANVVVATDAQQDPAGIATTPVPIAYYFWSQTGGDGMALVTNAVAVGTELMGAAAILAARTAFTDNSYGFVRGIAGVTSEYTPVDLRIV